ncbi:MAG TPA: hypothetical protein VFX50_08700 [Gemmatimonadales bacterium]|nr:hypothetical protein [Gemmatimonadales bacterium]
MVPRPRAALRATLCAIAAVAAAGCAAGDAGGAPFDASGTLEDLAAVTAAFDAPAIASFTAVSDQIDAALAAPVVAPAVRLLAAHDDAAFAARSREFVLRAAAYAHADPVTPRLAAVASLPSGRMGGTWEWQPARSRYVRTGLAGAPDDGVRFLLYAVDAATGLPRLPLRQLGYADVRDAGRGAEMATRVRVVSGDAAVLDYTIASAESSAGVSVTLRGTAGELAFALGSSFDAGLAGGRLDFRLDAPSRGVALDWAVSLHDLAGERPVDLDILMSGPHGNVVMAGSMTPTGAGTLSVLANGVAFAAITRAPGQGPVVSRSDGTPLASAEQGALLGILAMSNEGGTLFNRLLDPVDNVFR